MSRFNIPASAEKGAKMTNAQPLPPLVEVGLPLPSPDELPCAGARAGDPSEFALTAGAGPELADCVAGGWAVVACGPGGGTEDT